MGRATDEVSGLGVNIMGLDFALMLEPPDVALNPHFQRAKFRPNQIMITFSSSTNWIAISWEDGKKHTDTVSLKFLKTIET